MPRSSGSWHSVKGTDSRAIKDGCRPACYVLVRAQHPRQSGQVARRQVSERSAFEVGENLLD